MTNIKAMDPCVWGNTMTLATAGDIPSGERTEVRTCMKLYDKTCRFHSCQASEKQANTGDVDQGLAARRKALVVFAEPSCTA